MGINKKSIGWLLVLAVSLAVPPSLSAWDATGHRVVAGIAWEVMSPEARTQAATLLESAPADADLAQLMPVVGTQEANQRRLFMEAATWADIVRDRDREARFQKYHHGSWHYVNLFWESGEAGKEPRDRTDMKPLGQLVKRILAMEKTVGDRGRAKEARAIDLAWILHLVGDIHQPLHCSGRVTETEPKGDRGGNDFELAWQTKNERFDNLHRLWDGILTDEVGRRFWESRDRYETRLIQRILSDFPQKSVSQTVGEDDPWKWAKEGQVIAKTFAYPASLQRRRAAPRQYRGEVLEISEERIALAGYRLGHLLESSLNSGE